MIKKSWPQHFSCFCERGQLWWKGEQDKYSCHTCGKLMVKDPAYPASGLFGVWIDGGVVDPMLSREQAWARTPQGTMPIAANEAP